jgi:hypothetical protein
MKARDEAAVMEQAELEAVRRQFDEQVRSRFPQSVIRQVAVLQYGDAPEVEPGQLLARVVVETPGDREGRERAFEAVHDSHHAAFKELREELNKLPVPVVLQFVAGGEPAEVASQLTQRGPIIQLIGPHAGAAGACGPGEAPGAALTPVMARLGAEDLQTLDTLIAAGIASSRAEAVRWALARIRERPAYEQLRARTAEIENLKSQF